MVGGACQADHDDFFEDDEELELPGDGKARSMSVRRMMRVPSDYVKPTVAGIASCNIKLEIRRRRYRGGG